MAAAGCADSALLMVSSLSRGHVAPQVGCTCICCQLPHGSTTCSTLAHEVCARLGRESRPPGQAWSFTVLLEALLSALLSL